MTNDAHGSHAMPRAATAGTVEHDLVLSTEPKAPAAKVKTRLVLDPRRGDQRAQCLTVVHEKSLHLVVVSRDLSFYAHEHPERQPDGTYALDFTFPTAGEFVLFGDFTPEGASGQIVRMPVSVAGERAPEHSLDVDERPHPKAFGELSVALASAPIVAGTDTMLAFTIERGGEPTTGLRPHLGAMGHCVAIDETTTKYLHGHPQTMQTAGPANVVRFHTVFPSSGKYKVWGEFDVDGELLVAGFVVDVAAGAADSRATRRT